MEARLAMLEVARPAKHSDATALASEASGRGYRLISRLARALAEGK
jgi:hypothetical protein